MKETLAFVLIIVSTVAYATNDGKEGCRGNCRTDNGAPNEASARQSQTSIQKVDQRQTSTQTLAADVQVAPVQIVEVAPGAVSLEANPTLTNKVEGDEINIDVKGDEYSANYSYDEAAATAIAGYGNTTSSCVMYYGLGGTTRDSGWSLGLPVLNDDCIMGEDAAQAFMMGNELIGWKLYCHQPNVLGVYGRSGFLRRTFGKAEGKVSKDDAVALCIADTNAWQRVRAVETARAELEAAIAPKIDQLTQLVAAQAEIIATLQSVSHKPGSVTPGQVRQIIREEVPQTRTESSQEAAYDVDVSAVHTGKRKADVAQRTPQPPLAAAECPPPGVRSAICDGLPTLNPAFLGKEVVQRIAQYGLTKDDGG